MLLKLKRHYFFLIIITRSLMKQLKRSFKKFSFIKSLTGKNLKLLNSYKVIQYFIFDLIILFKQLGMQFKTVSL